MPPAERSECRDFALAAIHLASPLIGMSILLDPRRAQVCVRLAYCFANVYCGAILLVSNVIGISNVSGVQLWLFCARRRDEPLILPTPSTRQHAPGCLLSGSNGVKSVYCVYPCPRRYYGD